MKKQFYRIISFILCCVMVFSLCACNGSNADSENVSLAPPSNTGFWKKPNNSSSSDGNNWDSDLTPNINVTVIGGDTGGDENIYDNLEGEETVYDLVYENVSYSLTNIGFVTKNAMAVNYDDDTGASAVGIMYYREDVPIFADESYQGTGFYEILSEPEEISKLENVETLYVKNLEDENDITTYLAAYDYQNIGYDHFVYNGKYVVYYQESDNVIRYIEKENTREEYDLSLGSLFDYDKGEYIYDSSIFGDYIGHSGNSLISKQDYAKLEDELKVLSEQQLANGYEVLEYNIVYISPESIQAYLSSKEEDTFFGYNVDELTAAFGLGTALTYNGTTFEKSTIIPKEEGYNWKSFLIKMGIGSGIILVGAILSPVTGGASFGCALLTISKVAVSYALSSAIGILAIETVAGLIQGKTIEEALKGATHKGLDAFANGFMIGAAVGSVGLLTGVIKPSACFVAGTSIAVGYSTFKSIEDICVGDYVLSYNENDETVSRQKVIDTFSKEVYQTIGLAIDGGYIETTYNHPFYSPVYNCWIEAGSLRVGDYVVDSSGNCQVVQDIQINNYSQPVTVYNFTVKNNHTYFVGESEILVHNTCNDVFRKAGNEAGKKAKAQALDDIVAGRNYKKWGLNPSNPKDLEVIKYVQKYKTFKGSGCEFAHAIDVNVIKDAYKSGKITYQQALDFCANPNNGILTSKATHRLLIHAGNVNNPSDLSIILKARPSIRETIKMIQAALGVVA